MNPDGMDLTEEMLFAHASGTLDEREARNFEGQLERSSTLRQEAERYERLVVLLRAAAEEDVRAPQKLAGKINRQVMLNAYLKAATGLFEGVLGAYGRAVLYYLK
ncbi:MAG: anti-sigma factor family protein [Rubrobacter sp.]